MSLQTSDIPSYAVDLIDSIAVKEGFTEYKATFTEGSTHMDGFIGILLRVVINGTKRSEAISPNGSCKLSLIMKLPPDSKVRQERLNSKQAFENEIFSYEILLPAMVKLQQDHCVDEKDGFFRFPKSYGTYADPENGNYALVMEDLAVRDYEMRNKFETWNFEHCKLVMIELGRYHALSFGLRDQSPAVFAELSKRRPTFLMNLIDKEKVKNAWSQKYTKISKMFETEENEWADKIEALGSTYVERIRECCAQNAAEPFSVMNHGDCWNNNIMYRYESGSKEPEEICLIDWQISQWCSPAMDLSHFLFASTEKELRDKHYDELLRVYYQSLSALLRRLGSDPEKLFKFNDLQEQLRKFSYYGLIMAPLVITISNNFDDVAYKKRVYDVVRDFFKYGYEL